MTELIEKISELYNIPHLDFSEKVAGGFLTNNFILTDGTNKYFLKHYRFTDEQKVREVHQVKEYFYKKGIPVIFPLTNTNTLTYSFINSGYYALFPFVEGKTYSERGLSEQGLQSAGSMLATIHLHGTHTPFSLQDQSKAWDTEKFLQKANAILALIREKQTKDNFDTLAGEVIKLKISLAERNTVEFARLNLHNDHIIHGDYHVNNLFFDNEDNVKYVFDWGKTEMAPRAAELVRSLYTTCFDTNYSEDSFKQAHIYLGSYNKLYPIHKEELANAITLAHIKHMHSLWVETEHYINNNFRVDVFLHKELKQLQFLSKNLISFTKILTSELLNH